MVSSAGKLRLQLSFWESAGNFIFMQNLFNKSHPDTGTPSRIQAHVLNNSINSRNAGNVGRLKMIWLFQIIVTVGVWRLPITNQIAEIFIFWSLISSHELKLGNPQSHVQTVGSIWTQRPDVRIVQPINGACLDLLVPHAIHVPQKKRWPLEQGQKKLTAPGVSYFHTFYLQA